MRKKQNIGPLILSVILIWLVVTGCSQKESQETNQVLFGETREQISEVFVQMLENHPLHRHGELSPNKRYYAYEERSSSILVQLPTAQEYLADKTLVPKVLFIDGIRKGIPFSELEADYAQRLKQPLLTMEERNEAGKQLRSVYDWRNFYSQKFSQDGRYLAYLGFDNFGSDRICTVYVLDLEDNCRLYNLR